MADALAEIEAVVREGEAELASVTSPDALEQWRIKYLGTKGRMKGLMGLVGQAPPDQKRAVGQGANAANSRGRSRHIHAPSTDAGHQVKLLPEQPN